MRKLKTEELGRDLPDEFRNSVKRPVRIILDNIRSLHNIGSVFRTADAFAIECICLCGISAVPPNREIHKTALGATETVSWSYFPSAAEAAGKAKQDGYQVIAVEQTDESIPLPEFHFTRQRVALIFGNEINGVSDDVLKYADTAVEIPQFGTKHSLNIAVCAGIVMYQLSLKI